MSTRTLSIKGYHSHSGARSAARLDGQESKNRSNFIGIAAISREEYKGCYCCWGERENKATTKYKATDAISELTGRV